LIDGWTLALPRPRLSPVEEKVGCGVRVRTRAARLRGGRLEVGQAGEVTGGGQFEPQLVAGRAEVVRLAAGAHRRRDPHVALDHCQVGVQVGAANLMGRPRVERRRLELELCLVGVSRLTSFRQMCSGLSDGAVASRTDDTRPSNV